jgi:hypothetical protein
MEESKNDDLIPFGRKGNHGASAKLGDSEPGADIIACHTAERKCFQVFALFYQGADIAQCADVVIELEQVLFCSSSASDAKTTVYPLTLHGSSYAPSPAWSAPA